MIKSEDVNPQEEKPRPTRVVKKQDTKTSAKVAVKEAIQSFQDTIKEAAGGRVLMKMERENISFITDGGVKFTQEQPFQLVEEWEVPLLLRQDFRRAYPEEVEEHYNKGFR